MADIRPINFTETASESDLNSENFLWLDTPQKAKKLPGNAITSKSLTIKGLSTRRENNPDYTTNHYINADGSLSPTSNWTAFYYNSETFEQIYAELISSIEVPLIAFYSSTTVSADTFISGIPAENYDVNDPKWNKLSASVPSGTKCIVIASRTESSNEHKIYITENLERVTTLQESVDTLQLTADKTYADSFDHYYFNGSEFGQSDAWTRYLFNNIDNNFVRVRAVAASLFNTYGLFVFLDADDNVLSYVEFGAHDVPVDKTANVPAGCKKIAICNRDATYATPSVYMYSPSIKGGLDSLLKNIKDNSQGIVALEARFLAGVFKDYVIADSYYYNGSAFVKSTPWTRFIYENHGYKTVIARAASNNADFGEVVFMSDENSVISYDPFGSAGVNVDKVMTVPEGCKYIAICNRQDTLNSPDAKFYCENLQRLFEVARLIPQGVCGAVKFKSTAEPPIYNTFGDISEIASHFKLSLVKDGILKYKLNQTNINKDIEGKFDSVLDGTDGDILVVNDVPIYMICGMDDNFEYRLFSLEPFVFDGVSAEKIECRGEAPSYCFVDNINDSDKEHHEENLGNGKTHFVRNSANAAYFVGMRYIVGKYVPSVVDGEITYFYDDDKSFLASDAIMPSAFLTQSTAEKAAMNKDVGSTIYTNMDLLSLDIVLALAQIECSTKRINDSNLFGNGYSSDGATPTEDLFESGTSAINGVRFKDSNDAWVYRRLNAKPFDKELFLFEMLTDWQSPWEIMEQHLALSYAKTNNIDVNTWFVFRENEYKYINVGNLKGLSDGVMTAVLFKKYRGKLGDVTYDGASVQGNDIEFVIISSLYRGWVLDVSPHRWITGLNVTINDSNDYSFFATHNYNKYIMDKDYTEISEESVFDFEKQYDFIGTVTNSADSIIFPKLASLHSIYAVPDASAANKTVWQCGVIETDKKKADSGKKIVTGVKLGYGPFSGTFARNYLYLWHPRDYYVAKAGYSSFVCQKVQV